MVHLSLYLPIILHQRLVITSKQQHKSLSLLARELLDNALLPVEHIRLEKMYKILTTQGGFGPKGIVDGSTAINETLYGDLDA